MASKLLRQSFVALLSVMGIIIRQSVKGAIWSYLGIVIGYINVGIIMPQFLNTAQVGLVQLFASVSLIFAQFGTLGFTTVINRLFPIFRNQQKHHNGFLFLAVSAGILGFLLTLAAFAILKPWIIETNLERSPLLVEYLWLLIPLVFMRIIFILLDNYNKVLYDAVTGTFWIEFMHKLINLVLVIMFAFGWISFRIFFAGYLLSLSIPVIPVMIVLIARKNFNLKPQLSFLNKPLRKETGQTLFFGFINGMAGILLVNVDKVFVNQYLSLSEVGVFGVCTLFASLIRVPYNAVSKIATGIIAEAWKRNDRAEIQDIYQKSAVNQAIVGMLIFAGIVVNLHNIFRILPAEYEYGKWVLLIYSGGILVSTVLGLAGFITETSRHYRFSTLFLGLSILIQFGLSALLIPLWGITGAALATALTLIINALFQVTLQKTAYGIYGMSFRLLGVGAIGAVSILAGWGIPKMGLIPDIVIRSSVVVIVNMGLVFLLRISAEWNQLAMFFLQKIEPLWKRK